MQLSFQKSSIKNIKADVVAAFIHEDKQLFGRETTALSSQLGPRINSVIESGDFKGKESEIAVVYLDRGSLSRRLLLVGLGQRKKLSLEKYRRAAANAAKRARSLKARTIVLALPTIQKQHADAVIAFAEGSALALYRYDKYLSKKEEDEVQPDSIILCSDDSQTARLAPSAIEHAQVIIEATHFARDLANAPGSEIYPETLAQAALDSAKRAGYGATILDEDEIKELGMGGVIAVCRGSARSPRFIILEYGKPNKNTIVLVGKGVTFDTGGISLKPAANMSEMKMDKSGAAAVIGTFEAASRLKLPVHLVGLIPAVENMPGGNATRPGDIIRHYNGKTSEVDNTDAEGRLILADALAYADKYKPAAVIDLATLTGACVVALGHFATGMMGNDNKLMDRLKAAGEKTYERVWPLPLFDEYEKLIKSDVADVKNTGGRWAGAITAAWFLKKFIGNYKWVHLDIAGTGILEEAGEYTPKGGSGVGVRLLTEFLRNWKA